MPPAWQYLKGSYKVSKPPQFAMELQNPVTGATYYAISPLDEGGFGQVWDGLTSHPIPVAIKVTKPTADFIRDHKTWLTELNVYLQCLEHEFIVTTFDQFMTTNGLLVIVMEKAAGSLHSLVDGHGPISPLLISTIGCQMLSALDHIHSRNVIHRDVTLNNILYFPNFSFKLADFGISHQSVHADELARTLIGKGNYLAPEMFMGYTSRQSDIYQLGLVLLTLLTGYPPIPFDATWEEARPLILNGHPRALAESLIPVHGKLAEVIAMMLRRRQEWRYQKALDAWRDLYEVHFAHLSPSSTSDNNTSQN